MSEFRTTIILAIAVIAFIGCDLANARHKHEVHTNGAAKTIIKLK